MLVGMTSHECRSSVDDWYEEYYADHHAIFVFRYSKKMITNVTKKGCTYDIKKKVVESATHMTQRWKSRVHPGESIEILPCCHTLTSQTTTGTYIYLLIP